MTQPRESDSGPDLGSYSVMIRYKQVALAWQLVERSVGDVLEKSVELIRKDPELIMRPGLSGPTLTVEVRRHQ